jgi:hypothetical protein
VKRAAIVVFAVVASLSTAAGAAEAPWAKIAEGAPVYAAARPAAVLTALKRFGVGELPEVKQIRQQMAGIDPLDPLVLSPTGIESNVPAVVSAMEPAGAGRWHHRVVAALRDRSIFQSFLAGLGMTKQVPLVAVEPGSPLAAAGVLAWAPLGNKAIAVVRATESEAIVDVVNASDGKPPAAAEVVKRWPVAPKTTVRVERGARALFRSADAAVVVYADGRALGPVLQLLDRKSRQNRAVAAQCLKELAKAPASFDDVGLALSVTPEEVRAELDWGSQAGPQLGGLKLTPVDDRGYDVELLGRQAAAMIALFAASAQPFQALKRGTTFASTASLQSTLDRCGAIAWGTVAVRSWPQAIGAVAGKPPAPSGAGDTFNQAVQAFGKLRNLVLVARDGADGVQSIRYMVGATLDAEAKPLIESLLAIAGQGTQQTFGARSPTVYSLGALLANLTVALEPLKSGPLTVTLADSNETLGWSLRTLIPVGAPPTPQSTPLVRIALDGNALAKMLPSLQLGEKDERTLTQLLTRMRRLDGDAVIDGDRFRVVLRAPMTQPTPGK